MTLFDPDPRRWFISDRGNPGSSISLYTSENCVQPLIDGAAYWKSFSDSLGSSKEGDRVLYAGWRMGVGLQLDPPRTETGIERMIAEAHARGVDFRIMLSGHVANKNGEMGRHLAPLGVGCVVDGKHPRFGSFHQKLSLFHQREASTGYCGGIDIAPKRFDFPGHRLGGWHDVQCKVRGPACADIETTLLERWNHSESLDHRIEHQIGEVGTASQSPAGSQHVQVLRTYACGNGFAHARHGEFSARDALLRAISLAREYVYIEDQYFVSREFGLALATALRETPTLHVIVLVPKRPNFYLRVFYRHQREIIDQLRRVAPGRFGIFHLNNLESGFVGQQTYVHSKLVIVDDTWAQIGSVNFNRRSATYDAEASIAVIDENTDGNACLFARDLRLKLWAEHLGLQDSDESMRQPIEGFHVWKQRSHDPMVPAAPHDTPPPTGVGPIDALAKVVHAIAWRAVDPSGLC